MWYSSWQKVDDKKTEGSAEAGSADEPAGADEGPEASRWVFEAAVSAAV